MGRLPGELGTPQHWEGSSRDGTPFQRALQGCDLGQVELPSLLWGS